MAVSLKISSKAKYNSFLMGLDAEGEPWDKSAYTDWMKGMPHNDFKGPLGEHAPLEVLPGKIIMVRGTKLYDYNCFNQASGKMTAILVSQRFKDAVEALEPKVHQFVPVEVLHKDGTYYGEPFYLFTIGSVIDAINPETGAVKMNKYYNFDEEPDRYIWSPLPEKKDQLAVYKDRVAGRAAWRDLRLTYEWFFSDALYERMKAEKMEGYDIIFNWLEI